MSDSDEKDQGTPGQTKTAPAVTVEIVKHMGNAEHLTKRVRGEGGKFVKQPKTKPKSEDMVRYIRNVLNRAEANEDGLITRGSKSVISRMVKNITKNAMMDAERPAFDKLGNIIRDENGEPIKVVDPKVMMASAVNFKEIMLRGYGMPSKSDEELEAQKTQGVKIVILQHPEMMDKLVVEDKPREALKPAFIDAEIIEDK